MKKIQKEAEKYIFTNDKILYIPNPEDKSRLLTVPKPEDRLHLARTTHILGHFKFETTLERLQKNYYWKTMNNDIQRVIKTCLPCLRPDPSKVHEHPAIC